MITPDVLNVQGSLKLDGVPAVALIQAESHCIGRFRTLQTDNKALRQEDAAVAAQAQRKIWGNLQSISAMVTGHGCRPHVQDMVHQSAVCQ